MKTVGITIGTIINIPDWFEKNMEGKKQCVLMSKDFAELKSILLKG